MFVIKRETYIDENNRVIEGNMPYNQPEGSVSPEGFVMFWGTMMIALTDGAGNVVDGRKITFKIPEAKTVEEAFTLFDTNAEIAKKKFEDDMKKPRLSLPANAIPQPSNKSAKKLVF